jgi:anaerobic selenocysteine-containing dehydrogenase
VFFDPFADGFPTPSGRLEFYSEALERLGQPPLPTYVPSPQGHEFADDIYHLQLVTPPSLHFLNSSFGSSASSRRLEGRPTLQIHPTDAAARGIADGDLVRVFSRAGECFLYAEVTDAVAPGVVVAESIWWAKHSPGGKGINSVTTQLLTDLGGGGTFHGNLVGVEKVTSDE